MNNHNRGNNHNKIKRKKKKSFLIDVKILVTILLVFLAVGLTTAGAAYAVINAYIDVFLTPDRDYKRKIKEAYLAFQLERVFHKEEILEYYLNCIYFDYSTNGVEAASQMFFRKSVGDLTVAEAAMLVGVPNNPSLFSPYRSKEGSRNRQLIILRKMLELGMITQKEYHEAKDEEITIYPPPSRTVPHFHFYEYLIHHELRKLLPTIPELAEIPWHIAMYKGGLHI